MGKTSEQILHQEGILMASKHMKKGSLSLVGDTPTYLLEGLK